MSSKEIILITTALTKISKKKKNLVFLGEWCHVDSNNNLDSFKQNQTIKHHWCKFSKRQKDVKYLEKHYERILRDVSNKLNKIHKVKKDLRYWRLILGPWLIYYIVTMFDRWENLRIFFKINRNKKKKTHYSVAEKDIFYNLDTKDYLYKSIGSDYWNYNNYLRIIKFKYLSKIILEKTKFVKHTESYNVKNKLSIKNFFSTFLFRGFDFIFSFFGIRYNKVIIDTLYFSKFNQLKLFFKLKLIPSFYYSTFKDISFDKKKYFNLDSRNRMFNNQKKFKDPFINYLYFAMKTDFPIVFLEKFNDVQNLNFKLNKLRKKLIITALSHMWNERFKIWAAEMITKGAKFHVASHGGFLPFKIEEFFSHHMAVSDKYLTWRSAKEERWKKKRIRLSPVQLLKNINFTASEKKTCLILHYSVLRYAKNIQSFPYAEQYKAAFNNICEVVENLSNPIKKEVIYRCAEKNDNFFRTIKKFSIKFKNLKTQEAGETSLRNELKKTKLIICTHPETPVCDAIVSNIPTVIVFSEKLFQLTKNSKKILNHLKKNKIYFDDPVKASKHINKIWDNPDIWWKSKSTIKCLEKLKKFAFNIEDDWQSEWVNHIKKNI